ncbi:MAG: U32 family peptidase, partial [Planctomycetales bacterium]|nr:U32 family peptidase [Planctomycetales bacterium]
PDLVLIRNFASLSYFQEKHPQIKLVGDYSLNVANELTARLFFDQGFVRQVPSYDLNWKQLLAMLKRFPAAWFEQVVHQHMPMFHMEHCVFAATLSNGKDYRDCGRPCEHHRVELRDRRGELHPLLADVGCRNTLYNSMAQSATEYIPRMLEAGLRHFRVELLREDPGEIGGLL